MDNDLFVNDLANGSGTIKYYDYFINGIIVKNKSCVYEAIKLKISNILRRDKINNEVTKFNYENLKFEKEVK